MIYLSVKYFEKKNVNIKFDTKDTGVANIFDSSKYEGIKGIVHSTALTMEYVLSSMKPNLFNINGLSNIVTEAAQIKNDMHKKVWNIPKPKIHEKIEIRSKPRVDHDYCGKHHLIIIFCLSTAENVAHRNAIRDTWANVNRTYNKKYKNFDNLKYKVIFVIGKTAEGNLNLAKEISEEIKFYNDIIELNFPESRYEYTRKFIASVKWLNNISCFNLVFVLKTVDDTFINIPPFMDWLTAVFFNSSNLEKVYFGHIVKQDQPIRNIQHPLYTSKEDYPEDTFPDYIQSPIYLLSADVLSCMNNEINNVPILPMEDAYIGLLAVKCSILPHHNEHFVLLGMPDNFCHHKRMFFMGNIKPIEEIKVFHYLSDGNNECNENGNNEL